MGHNEFYFHLKELVDAGPHHAEPEPETEVHIEPLAPHTIEEQLFEDSVELADGTFSVSEGITPDYRDPELWEQAVEDLGGLDPETPINFIPKIKLPQPPETRDDAMPAPRRIIPTTMIPETGYPLAADDGN